MFRLRTLIFQFSPEDVSTIQKYDCVNRYCTFKISPKILLRNWRFALQIAIKCVHILNLMKINLYAFCCIYIRENMRNCILINVLFTFL